MRAGNIYYCFSFGAADGKAKGAAQLTRAWARRSRGLVKRPPSQPQATPTARLWLLAALLACFVNLHSALAEAAARKEGAEQEERGRACLSGGWLPAAVGWPAAGAITQPVRAPRAAASCLAAARGAANPEQRPRKSTFSDLKKRQSPGCGFVAKTAGWLPQKPRGGRGGLQPP